jgi:hypothetical protein
VLPAAKVTVTNEATGLTRSNETNSTGEYRVPFLPVGVYTVRVEKQGFKTQKQVEIPLDDSPLADQPHQPAVAVKRPSPGFMPLPTRSSRRTVIKNEQVTISPTSDSSQLTYRADGCTAARDRTGGQSRHLDAGIADTPEQNNYQIDGIDNKENGCNNAERPPSGDSVSNSRQRTARGNSDGGG